MLLGAGEDLETLNQVLNRKSGSCGRRWRRITPTPVVAVAAVSKRNCPVSTRIHGNRGGVSSNFRP